MPCGATTCRHKAVCKAVGPVPPWRRLRRNVLSAQGLAQNQTHDRACGCASSAPHTAPVDSWGARARFAEQLMSALAQQTPQQNLSAWGAHVLPECPPAPPAWHALERDVVSAALGGLPPSAALQSHLADHTVTLKTTPGDRCQLTRRPWGRVFREQEVNDYLTSLFATITTASRSRPAQQYPPVTLSRYDLFHAHLILTLHTPQHKAQAAQHAQHGCQTTTESPSASRRPAWPPPVIPGMVWEQLQRVRRAWDSMQHRHTPPPLPVPLHTLIACVRSVLASLHGSAVAQPPGQAQVPPQVQPAPAGSLGLVFHCAESPAYDEDGFPYYLGYCQEGSTLAYNPQAFDKRNVVYVRDRLVFLDAGVGTCVHEHLLWDETRPLRTVYESDLGVVLGDVNLLLLDTEGPPGASAGWEANVTVQGGAWVGEPGLAEAATGRYSQNIAVVQQLSPHGPSNVQGPWSPGVTCDVDIHSVVSESGSVTSVDGSIGSKDSDLDSVDSDVTSEDVCSPQGVSGSVAPSGAWGGVADCAPWWLGVWRLVSAGSQTDRLYQWVPEWTGLAGHGTTSSTVTCAVRAEDTRLSSSSVVDSGAIDMTTSSSVGDDDVHTDWGAASSRREGQSDVTVWHQEIRDLRACSQLLVCLEHDEP